MKIYVLTDEMGDTGTGLKLDPGSLGRGAALGRDMLGKLGNSGSTAELAALLSPIQSVAPKLFLIQAWSVESGNAKPQTYTVKEVDAVPAVTLQKRLTFAVLTFQELFKDRDFNRWATQWLNGTDRSAASAASLQAELNKELKANEDLGGLAAWGVSFDDNDEASKIVERALHVARAAELVAVDPGLHTNASREIDSAVRHIGKLCASANLAQLAARAMGQGGTRPAQTGGTVLTSDNIGSSTGHVASV
jgi:hypothetical protein